MQGISVVTITMNRLSSLRNAIASLDYQDDRICEHIIQDGGSTDGTDQYVHQLKNSKIKYFRESDLGISDALNKAIQKATGDWILILHSDDQMLPEAIETVWKHLCVAGSKDLHAFAANMLDKDGVLVRTFLPDPVQINKKMTLPHTAMIFAKRTFQEIGGFDTSKKIAMDYDWVLRALKAGNKIVPHDEIIQNFSMTGASSRNYFRGRLEVFASQLKQSNQCALRSIAYLIQDITAYSMYKMKRFIQKTGLDLS